MFPKDSRFGWSRIVMVVVAGALMLTAIEVFDIGLPVLASIAILGGIVILLVWLFVLFPILRIVDNVLELRRSPVAGTKIAVAEIVSIEDQRLASPDKRRLLVRGQRRQEILIDADGLDRREIAFVLEKLRTLRPDLTIPDLLSDEGVKASDL